MGRHFRGPSASPPIYNVKQFSYRVALIPDALQGRVNSAFRLLAFGFQPLGAALAGVLIEQVGVDRALGVFAAVQIGLALMTMLNGQIRHARPIAGVAESKLVFIPFDKVQRRS